ncbi:MAG: hypothetical protein H5T74_12440 [Actinobacteria bacterium]|nr:hypothetical protein [Actinomycetota bacterium]
MRLAADLLKVLFFPGLLFMAACGELFLFLEEGLFRLAGGGGSRGYVLKAAAPSPPLSPGEALAVLLPPAALGLAGVLLVWVEGDLLSLALLVAVPGLLPLALPEAGEGERAARVPLRFRASLARLFALGCATVGVSMRYPGAFAPELEGLIAEGAFGAFRYWKGAGSALIFSSQACAAAALFFFLLGRPAYGRGEERWGSGVAAATALAEGAERAVTLLLFVLVCLGYPWKGPGGALAWGASASGMALAATGGRAWLEGRNAVFRRRALLAAPALAALSLALAMAAAVLGG